MWRVEWDPADPPKDGSASNHGELGQSGWRTLQTMRFTQVLRSRFPAKKSNSHNVTRL
jgi:hypothetical protein